MEGRLNKSYRNTGTRSVPVWSSLGRISDVKIPQGRSTSEFNYIDSENIKSATGKKNFNGLSFKYHTKKDPSLADATLAALQASFDDETMLDLAFVDQAIATSGATGIRGPFVVSQFDRDQADESNTTYDVSLVEIDFEDATDGRFDVDTYTTP